MMNVYMCTGFPGHNPVGTSAVVVANDRGHARRLLAQEMGTHGLELSATDEVVFTKVRVDCSNATILNDGQY